MLDLKFRSLRQDDLDRVSEIEKRITGTSRHGYIEKYLAIAASSPENFITCAALSGEKLIGYGFARIMAGDFGIEDTVAVLDVIGVNTDAQGKGVGKKIILEIEKMMKKKKIGTLRTQTVWTDQRMTRLFSSVGFELAPSKIIERDTTPLNEKVPEISYKKMDSVWQVHSARKNDFVGLSRDNIWVRSLNAEDLASVILIDRKLTGFDRSAYFKNKFSEMLNESGIRVSLAAEVDGSVIGFVMVRVDFGAFGEIDKTAVLDSIGVHPLYAGSGIGTALLSQLLINLSTLKVASVRTQVHDDNYDLQRFLHWSEFKSSQRLVLAKSIS